MRKALVVGIDEYPIAPLFGCVNDAVRIAQILERHGNGDPNFEVKLMISPSELINRPRLRKEIEELFSNDPDVALLYFSGHGFVKSTGGFVVTSDFERYDEGVSMDEILQISNQSGARNRVIILDCCYSGALAEPNFPGGAMYTLRDGSTVLTACRKSEPALERSGQGIFTSLLLEALEGGAADLRGHVTPGSLYSYVDSALGAWDQRPVFKTNVSRFVSLRQVTSPLSIETIRKITQYFVGPTEEFYLDPSFEFTSSTANADNVALFKELQKMASVGLVKPTGEDHMYYAAMHSKSCHLTAIGYHYWRLVKEGKV